MLADKNSSSDHNSLGFQKKNRMSFFYIYGVPLLYFFLLIFFILNYLTMTRVRNLENEVEVLKQTLSLFDDNLIKDIIGFEDEEENESYDSNQDPRIIIPYGKTNEYLDYEIHDNKNKENKTNHDEDSYTKLLNKLITVDDDNAISEFHPINYKKESIRQKRNILAATNDGVIINSESYSEKKAKNVSSRYNLRGGSVTQYPARQSSMGSPWPVYPYSYSTAAYYQRIKTTKAPNVFIRNSRVKHFDDKSKAFKQKVKASNLRSLDSYQDSNEDTTTYTPPVTIVRNANFRRRSIKHLPSVHYNGDTSKYVLGVHDNFYGNEQLRHLNEIFVDWKATEWVETLKMHSHFTLENGYVTVKQTGLYLIYAQIYYMDTHDRVGFKVFRNDKVILECAITSPSIGGSMKSNTCYTSGVEHFHGGDRLSIKDIEQRMSLFANGKSFFGMVKLGNISV